jgi:DNA-directed RNA polymerase specialized sigma24 family protein
VLQLINHIDATYNLAKWLTQNEHDAEDIVQDAYVRAIGTSEAFKAARGRHGSWRLFAIYVTTP